MRPAPIILFTYNRPWHTEQTLRSLAANHLARESKLIVYADGPKPGASDEQIENIRKVRDLLERQTWCNELIIHCSPVNLGLAVSVIKGVTETLQRYDRAIVLEDDMILSPYFLQFMNDALTKYEGVDRVISVHGYCLPIDYPEPAFFLRGADCWGWATWRRGWQLFNPDSKQLMEELKTKKLVDDFDFGGNYDYSGMLQKQIDGQVDSWAIRWYASAYLANKLTLYPGRSLVQNIGGDGSGTHLQDEKQTRTVAYGQKVILSDIAVEESPLARKLITRYLYRTLGLKGKLKKLITGRS